MTADKPSIGHKDISGGAAGAAFGVRVCRCDGTEAIIGVANDHAIQLENGTDAAVPAS